MTIRYGLDGTNSKLVQSSATPPAYSSRLISLMPDSRALDELDVYLDEINRAEVEEMLLAFAKENPVYQFIFISPTPPNSGEGVNVIEIEKK